MPESFLHLDAQEQSQIYRALAPQLARSPVVLEKDVWVCLVLQILFTMPGRLPMAFKGGTYLIESVTHHLAGQSWTTTVELSAGKSGKAKAGHAKQLARKTALVIPTAP